MEPGALPTSVRMKSQLWRNALLRLKHEPIKRRYRFEGPEKDSASPTKGVKWLASPGTAVLSARVSSPKRGTVIFFRLVVSKGFKVESPPVQTNANLPLRTLCFFSFRFVFYSLAPRVSGDRSGNSCARPIPAASSG